MLAASLALASWLAAQEAAACEHQHGAGPPGYSVQRPPLPSSRVGPEASDSRADSHQPAVPAGPAVDALLEWVGALAGVPDKVHDDQGNGWHWHTGRSPEAAAAVGRQAGRSFGVAPYSDSDGGDGHDQGEDGVPEPLRGIPGQVMMPGCVELSGLLMDDVCGLEAAKTRLTASVVNASKTASMLTALRRETRVRPVVAAPARLVVLHGPPGTGKTMLARAAAAAAGCPVLAIGFEDVADKYYGETQRLLQEVLDAAAEYASEPTDRAGQAQTATAGEAPPRDGATPLDRGDGGGSGGDRQVLIFVDEADSLLGSRSAGTREGSPFSDGADDRLVSQTLKFLDGGADRRGVVMVLATNRLAALDPALLSRASDVIEVLPPGEGPLRQMWSRWARHLSPEAVSRLAEAAAGLTGRDVARVCDAVERLWVAGNHPEGALPTEHDYARELAARRATLTCD